MEETSQKGKKEPAGRGNETDDLAWRIYTKAFLELPAGENRKILKKCERQIHQFEQRLERKKGQEAHQILNDMKDLHRRAVDIGYTATRSGNPRLIHSFERALRKLMRLDLAFLAKMAPSSSAEELLEMEQTPVLLRKKSLYEIYQDDYIRLLVGKRIDELMEAEPEKQYPRARSMHRHFILHIGPTNSGKTYQALQRLKHAYQGIYLGPLRLLALEVYDTMTAAGVPCSMITGEERIITPGAFCQASTIEVLDLKNIYDVAVIDEAQMLDDENRGSFWTRAILGIQAEEIHVCASPVAEKLLIAMIERCGDTFDTVYHERNTELEFIRDRYDMNRDVQKGDALIAFSKKNVLAIAAALESRGIAASVIYGNLPPKTRREQVELFAEGINDVVVATDAIGMGINLPIRRVVFMNSQKFDGKHKRRLYAEEIRQIAGRAGRYGYYDVGYVQSTMDTEYIGRKLKEPFHPIKKARIGFPEVLLDINMGLDEIIEAWEQAGNADLYDKISMDESVKKYHYLQHDKRAKACMQDKKLLLTLITCPFDLGDREVIKLWIKYCIHPEKEQPCPKYPLGKEGEEVRLEDLESY